jgi:hypothetical protein
MMSPNNTEPPATMAAAIELCMLSKALNIVNYSSFPL